MAFCDPELDQRFVLRSRSAESAALLFAQPRIRSLLNAPIPKLYSWRVSKRGIFISYGDLTGAPRDPLVGMLDHVLALVA